MDYQVGIVDDERCEYHIQSKDHPESPARVMAIRKRLKTLGLYDKLVAIDPVEPTKEDLLQVHTNRYINKVERTCLKYGHGMIGSEDVRVTGENSWVSAGVAAGSVLAAVDTVMAPNRIRKVFCNVRPPGHHASSHDTGGYCIFNNVAIGVKKALTYSKINRVLILDWDLHHGDGTQKIFQCSKDVMFVSFHRAAPFYPASGSSTERGKYGNVYNYPQLEQSTAEDYLDDFTKHFLPAATQFNPDIIFISCGFDGHKDDLYSALKLETSHFTFMTRSICLLANQLCEGRVISVLEGGYKPEILAECGSAHVGELINQA